MSRRPIIATLFLLGVSILSSRTVAQDETPVARANKLLIDRHYDEAIDFLNESLRRSPDTSALNPLLSKAYVGRGDKRASDIKYSDALSEYQSALKYSQDTSAYSGILSCYWYLRKDSALVDLSRTLRNSFPDFNEPRRYLADACTDKGFMLEMDGKYSEAISMFDQSNASRGRETAWMAAEIGDCYVQLKDTNRAIASYKLAFADSEFSLHAGSELAAIYRKRNEEDSLRDVVQRGLNYDPSSSTLWRYLLKLNERADRRPEALECKKMMARLGETEQKDELSHAGISYDRIDTTKFPWLGASFVSRADSIKKHDDPEHEEDGKAPVPTKQVTPDYPFDARLSKLEGTVWVKCLLGSRGDIRKAIITKSDDAVFNRPSLDAILKWKFEPALLKGKPVSVWITVPFRFKLKK